LSQSQQSYDCCYGRGRLRRPLVIVQCGGTRGSGFVLSLGYWSRLLPYRSQVAANDPTLPAAPRFPEDVPKNIVKHRHDEDYQMT
ncbi:MAG: hypothetical protein ACTSYX_11565, partial [Candidatus Thorarchaeota archaeon]